MPIIFQPHKDGMERVVLLDDAGRELSWLILVCQRIHIGRAVVRAGIVGHVFTPEEHRNKGYSKAVMNAALDAMVRRGYEIAFLFGIPNFYIKLGYSVVQHYYATALKFGRGSIDNVPGMKSSAYRPSDLPSVMRLYDSYIRSRTGGFVRSRDCWAMEQNVKTMKQCLCVRATGGRLAAYAKWDGKYFYTRLMGRDCMETMLLVPEAVAADAKTAQAMLFALAKLARSQNKEGILFLGPPDHFLSAAMYEFGAQFRRAIVPAGGIQAKIINLVPLMKKLRPNFTDRCKNSIFRRKPAKLSVSTDIGSFEMAANRGKVQIAPGRGRKFDWKVSAQELIRYVFGYCPPPKLAGAKGLFLKTIFPPQIAHSWAPDEMI